MKKYSLAENFFNESLINFVKINDRKGISYVYSNFSNIYEEEGKPEMVIKYLLLFLKISEEIGNTEGITGAYLKLGEWYKNEKQYKKAEESCLKAIELSRKNEALVYSCDAYKTLSSVYEESGKDNLALEYFTKYIVVRDSLVNEENTKKLVKTEMNYEFDRKETAAKIEQEKKEAVSVAEKRKHKIVLWVVSFICVLVLTFALFAYRSFLMKKRANIEISKQKDLIQEKQKEILDSIHYAKRIQTALLTNEQYITRML